MGGIFYAGLAEGSAFDDNSTLGPWSREAMFYSTTPHGVRCLLCPNACLLANGITSKCHNRISKNGKLYTLAYGNPCAVHVDPIEKKPLYHFLPGSQAFSIATAGCNFTCLNCLNWEISQVGPNQTVNRELIPEKVVEHCIANNCDTIAYTYTEPITFYEYVYDTAKLAKSKGIRNILISNGYINPEPLRQLAPLLDGANINLKSLDDKIYQKLNGGRLQTILDTITYLKDNGVWLEVTTLIIPGWTDDFDMIKRMCKWLVENGFENVPLHYNRFFPKYKLLNTPPTPIATLVKAKQIAIEAGMHYIYLGNTPEADTDSTICPKCKHIVVERVGYNIRSIKLKEGKCMHCGNAINGVWS